MKLQIVSFARRVFEDELGQTLPVVILGMFAFLGIGGLSIELGHGYNARQELLASTNAATLAGAAAMPDTTLAAKNVTAYSAATGGYNVSPRLQNVKIATSFQCLTAVSTKFSVACTTSTGAAGGYNALSVTQTADVPLWFGKMFGFSTFKITATSTAAMRGGSNTPWNIAIILDTTASMASTDSTGQCSGTRITCALKGVQALLSNLDPCALGVTCNSSASPVDSVSLYVFPPILTTTASKDYVCPTSNPTHEYYKVPTLDSAWTYQVIPFSNDFRVNDTAGLNTGSNIVVAAGAGSCSGIQAPGGAGTYYAQVIYAAQAALVAQQHSNPGSQNAMIILTDGDATASVTLSGSGASRVVTTTSQLQPSATNSLNGIAINNPTSYTYPSAVGECGQAVEAAQAAAKSPNGNSLPGTKVFTIGYGSPTSGCSTDSSYSGTFTGGGGNWSKGNSPCQALAAMASSPINFYSDNANGCKATVPTNANITKLTQIFQAIISGLTVPRLIPNGTV